jgi:hypothetical protein
MIQMQLIVLVRGLGLVLLVATLGCGGGSQSDAAATSPAPDGQRADSPSAAGQPVPTEHSATAPPANDAATTPAPKTGSSDPSVAETSTSKAAQATPEPTASIHQTDPTPSEPATPEAVSRSSVPPPEVEGLTRLDPKSEVWIDPTQKRVLMTGEIVRREGQMEMFACLKNTKEHESVVAANTKAYIVNAALIALGANPGGPVEFRPEFKPPRGPEVEVTVIYTDKHGKRQQTRAQEWIRNIKSGKELDQPWVFAGSGFWQDESTGQRHFMAEDGDFICISNFTSAMLDLPVESSQASADLMFEAFTERIPPVKTPVVLVLKPKLDENKKPAEATEPMKRETEKQN